MNKPDIQTLNDKFSLNSDKNQLRIIEGKGGIPFIEIFNQHASALISLQGAHLLSWVPKDEKEVIWLSDDAVFAQGKSVRGGIPICWPWFGKHKSGNDQTASNFPAHGFARTTDWQILCTEALENGNTRISFTTTPQTATAAMWPADTTVQYTIDIGIKLELELITHNNGAQPVTIGQALHTYFRVGDIAKTRLHGLDDTDYLDKPDNFKRKVQYGPVLFEQETDRIYLNTASDCVIEDRTLNRNIVIIKCGSHSTVVWNPWQEVADKMGDLGKEGYKNMLCVESANAADDVVTIQPGEAHTLWVQYGVQKLLIK
jgi:glucose-6-phosphate 1-epimerase